MTEKISQFQEWYSLGEELVPYIGERACSLFAHTIFTECGDVAAASRLRGELAESGTDVDLPQVTEAEQLLIDWGRLVARDARAVGEEWRTKFDAAFNPTLRTALVRFAALTIATAVVDSLSPTGVVP